MRKVAFEYIPFLLIKKKKKNPLWGYFWIMELGF